jgi:hypothetical protein
MSAQTIQSATDRFNLWKTSLSAFTVTDFVITPGYGYSWKQNGVAASARIPEIEANDADYIATFQKLVNDSSGQPNNNLTGAAGMGWLPVVLIIGVSVFVLRWIWKKIKRKGRKR